MSVKALAYVWEHSKQRGARLLVLLALADNANDGGWSWYTVPKIAAKARQDAGDTRDYLRDLYADDEILIYDRKQDSGINSSNLYRVNFPGASDELPEIIGELVLRPKPAKRSHTGEKRGTRKNTGTRKIPQGDTGKKGETDPSVDPSDSSSDDLRVRAIFTLYENAIGLISSIIRDDLIEAARTYPAEWVADAFKEAVAHNARSWAYVLKVLQNWQAKGRDWKPAQPAAATLAPATPTTPSAPQINPFRSNPS